MNILKENKKTVLYILSILIFVIVFLFMFSGDTSPLAKYYYGADSSLFMLFGRGLNNGKLPYRDLFDHKGPYYYFLQQIGQSISTNKIGIFILQIINFSLIIILIIKILKLANKNLNSKAIVVCVLLCFWLLSAEIEGGNTNEEFSLPFSLLSLYFAIKYFNQVENNDVYHSSYHSLLYGIFFGIISFSRLPNATFICSIVFSIYVFLLFNNRMKCLLKNILFFVVGFAIAIIPIILFYYLNGCLKDMLYSTFVFAYKYSSEETIFMKIKDCIFSINFLFFLPSLIPMFYLFNKRDNNKLFLLFSIVSTVTTFIAIVIGNNYLHYYILAIPNFVFGLYVLIKTDFQINKKYTLIILLILLFQSVCVAKNFGSTLLHTVDFNFTENRKDYYKDYFDSCNEIIKDIPNNELDSLWGVGVPSKFYIINNTFPCIKYYDYLNQFLALGDVRKELQCKLIENKPKWIIEQKDIKIDKMIANVIDNDYIVDKDDEFFVLYKLK